MVSLLVVVKCLMRHLLPLKVEFLGEVCSSRALAAVAGRTAWKYLAGGQSPGGQNTGQGGCRAVQAGKALSWGRQQLKLSPQILPTAVLVWLLCVCRCWKGQGLVLRLAGEHTCRESAEDTTIPHACPWGNCRATCKPTSSKFGLNRVHKFEQINPVPCGNARLFVRSFVTAEKAVGRKSNAA